MGSPGTETAQRLPGTGWSAFGIQWKSSTYANEHLRESPIYFFHPHSHEWMRASCG